MEEFSRSDENENDCTGVTMKSTLAMDEYICSQEVVMIITWITIEILTQIDLRNYTSKYRVVFGINNMVLYQTMIILTYYTHR